MKRIIRDIRIIDGSGEPAFRADVIIENGKLCIERANSQIEGDYCFDGRAYTAVPGFIDAHSHGDLNMSSPFATLSKRNQGITTQIAGQCGVSMFPFEGVSREDVLGFISGIAPYPDMPKSLDYLRDMAGFNEWTAQLDKPINTFSFVGHGTLRLATMGYANRKPDGVELGRMKKLLRKCLRQGALGLSTGLVYAPNRYADNDEILALLRVCHEEGKLYATHPRNEADWVIESRKESIELCKKAKVALCVSHLKAAGRDNWGKAKDCLDDINRALDEGMDILIDCYPYLAGNTSLNVSIPPRYFAKGLLGLVEALKDDTQAKLIESELKIKSDYDNYIYNSGGFEGVMVSSCPTFHDAEGLTIAQYAQKTNQSPFEAYRQILIKNNGLGLGIYFHMGREDLINIFSHPRCVVSTDGLVGKAGDNPHPRSFGTMARAFRLLTQEERICSEEQAIHRMSGMTAEFLNLKGKGFLRTGYDADVLIIKPNEFSDEATYEQGARLCKGIEQIYQSGDLVYSRT